MLVPVLVHICETERNGDDGYPHDDGGYVIWLSDVVGTVVGVMMLPLLV